MPTIGDRLKKIMEGSSGREFANSLGKSPSTVDQYLKGRIPPADFIVLVCERHQVEPKWLLTGEGPMRLGNGPEVLISRIDEDLLEAVIEESEELLDSLNRKATPKQRTQLILSLYDLAKEREDHKIDRPKALRLIKLMAA
jgi:transcriptional regulator with XRE-family HTH domain